MELVRPLLPFSPQRHQLHRSLCLPITGILCLSADQWLSSYRPHRMASYMRHAVIISPFRCKVGIPTFRTSIQVHVVSKLSQWIFNPGKTSCIIVMRPSNQRDAPRELRAIQIALRNESQPQRFLPSQLSCTHVLRSVMQESAERHEEFLDL